MDRPRSRIEVSVAQTGPKILSSNNLCKPLAFLTHAVAKHGVVTREPTKAFEFLRELGSALEVEVSVTSEVFDSDRESVVSSASSNNSNLHKWGEQIAALSDATHESTRSALFDEVMEGLNGCTVNEALERLQQVERIAESLHEELQTRQKVHQEAIEELREDFARKESKLHAHVEHVQHGFSPNVVFSSDLNVLIPDIQQMLVHGGSLCAFGATGHATANRLALLASQHIDPLFDPVVIDVEAREDRDDDVDTAVGELNDSAVSVAAVEITAEGMAVNLLGRRANIRAFYQEHYGVTFPDLITVSVNSPAEVARLVESHSISTVDSMSAIVWMVKRGDCCYGPNRIVIVGLPPHAAPDDVNPKKIALLLQEGQLASFVCSDDIKTLSPTYERMRGRLQQRWRCRREGKVANRILHKANAPALAQVQREISRLRSPCHISYGEIYPKLRASSDSTSTFGEDALRTHIDYAFGEGVPGVNMDMLQDKLDSVMSSQNEILRSLQTHTHDDLPGDVPMRYNELQLKLSSMERLVEEKDAQLQAFHAQCSSSASFPNGTYKTPAPQMFRRPVLCNPASGSTARLPCRQEAALSAGENCPDVLLSDIRPGVLTARGRSPALDIRPSHSVEFHRTASAKHNFPLGSPRNITRILGTPVLNHREPRAHSADYHEIPFARLDGRRLPGAFSQLTLNTRNSAARISAGPLRTGYYNGSVAPGLSVAIAPRQFNNIGISPVSPPFSPQFSRSRVCATPQSPYGLSPVPPTPRSCVLREVRGTSCEKLFSPRSPKRTLQR